MLLTPEFFPAAIELDWYEGEDPYLLCTGCDQVLRVNNDVMMYAVQRKALEDHYRRHEACRPYMR